MDKGWIHLDRSDSRYLEGVDKFIHFVMKNTAVSHHPCPCRKCMNYGGSVFTLSKIRGHLLIYGMKKDYINWKYHGETRNEPSFGELRREYIMERRARSSQIDGTHSNLIMNMVDDAFPFREGNPMVVDDLDDNRTGEECNARDDFDKYNQLMLEAQTPLYLGCDKTVLETVLAAMEKKVENRWFDKSFNDVLHMTKELLPLDNKYPEMYRDVKGILRSLGLGYDTIHACEHGCVLFYKEYEELEYRPVCDEARYVFLDGKS